MAKWLRKVFFKTKEQRNNVQFQNISGHRGTGYQLQEHTALEEDQVHLLESASLTNTCSSISRVSTVLFCPLQTLHTCAQTRTHMYEYIYA